MKTVWTCLGVAIMVLALCVLANAYEAVSQEELKLVNAGYSLKDMSEAPAGERLTYFRDGSTATHAITKRWVSFEKESTYVKNLGGHWLKSQVKLDTVNLTLYHVTRVTTKTRKVTTTKTDTQSVEKKVPVKLYEKPGKAATPGKEWAEQAK